MDRDITYLRKRIGRAIQAHRHARDLSVADFAAAIGTIESDRIVRIEAGQEPNVSTEGKIIADTIDMIKVLKKQGRLTLSNDLIEPYAKAVGGLALIFCDTER